MRGGTASLITVYILAGDSYGPYYGLAVFTVGDENWNVALSELVGRFEKIVPLAFDDQLRIGQSLSARLFLEVVHGVIYSLSEF